MSIAIVLVLALMASVPIAIAFAFAVITHSESLGLSLEVLSGIPYEAISSFPLIAIPLFLLGGEIMRQGGLAEQLTTLCYFILRKLKAASGFVMLAASALFGSMTGSSVATVAAIGAIVGPGMISKGYPKGYIAALNASSGLLGVLLPPSIPLILYGSTVGVSIGKLFLATIAPAALMFLGFALVHAVMARRVLPNGCENRSNGPDWETVAPDLSLRVLLVRATPALCLPVVVLGGIYGGIFTPTEGAAVACVYAIILSFRPKSFGTRSLLSCFTAALLSSGAILIIIALTSIFTRAMVLNEVPHLVADTMTAWIDSKVGFLIAANCILLLVGMVMETSSAILLLGPLLAPAATHYGVDPVHFGIILVTNIEIGLLTPPLATNLFVAARANNAPIGDVLRYVGVFLGMAIAIQLLITFVPIISLWYEW